jgi:hypothetical protein
MARVNVCRHFTGIQNDSCKKGVLYREVRDESVKPFRFPCTTPGAEDLCEHRSPWTAAEVEEQGREMRERMFAVEEARAAILVATDGATGVAGKVGCPVCRTGKLSYSVARVNGHIHAQCSTDGCVRWME